MRAFATEQMAFHDLDAVPLNRVEFERAGAFRALQVWQQALFHKGTPSSTQWVAVTIT